MQKIHKFEKGVFLFKNLAIMNQEVTYAYKTEITSE